MAGRSRNYGQGNGWNDGDDYNTTTYDAQYPDDDVSGGANLDHCRLYITNIPRNLNVEGLRNLFSKFGALSEVFVSHDPQKKYALVKYETPGEAKLAMMKMNRTEPLQLCINVAYKSKNEKNTKSHRERERPEHANSHRQQTVDRNKTRNNQRDSDSASFSSRGRDNHSRHIMTQDEEMEENMEEECGYCDILDPELHLELETLKLEQLEVQKEELKVQKEELASKQRILLLKRAGKKTLSSAGGLSRCVLPDGKICVRNTPDKDADVPFSIGAGDSNETTDCFYEAKGNRPNNSAQEEPTPTTSTCIQSSDERSEVSYRKNNHKYISKIGDSKTTDSNSNKKAKKSECSKQTDDTSKKKVIYSKSQVTCDVKSTCYSESNSEDETSKLIQLRNTDYASVVDDELKLVIALAGYPKSKMRLKQMELFQKSLSDVIDIQLKSGVLKRVPAFLDYYLNRGALVCICKDVDTRDWIVRVSSRLQDRMSNNIILLKSKVKRLCLAILKIPKACWPATAQDAFKLLQYFNPLLRTSLWKIYFQKVVDDVECTSFLIDRVSGEIIRGPSFKNVIDYSQMVFELNGYTEIYYECLLSDMDEDLTSVASAARLLDDLRSGEHSRNNSETSVREVQREGTFIKAGPDDDNNMNQDMLDVKAENIQRELEKELQNDILNKLKDVKHISNKSEILVWSDDKKYSECDTLRTDRDKQNIEDNNPSTSALVSEKTESIIESDHHISRSSNLNIDSNRGIAYHRRTNYLHVENILKVAITLEGYPQNKLEGTHIRRLKHLFKEYVHKDMKSQRFANLIVPKFQDIYLSNGAVIYICDSLETKNYLTEVMPKFIKSTGLKLTFRDIKSLLRYTRIVMRLPKELAHVESAEILSKLKEKYANLKPDCWKYYSDVAGKQKRQFGVDPDSLEVIKSPDFDPMYNDEKLFFRIIDRQKRDASYEESHKDMETTESKMQKELALKNFYLPIDPKIMAAPLTRVRTNHYSDLIADDLKLYVGPCNYPETRIDEALFHTIKRTLENIFNDHFQKDAFNDGNIPRIHDIYLFDGVIFIICVDIMSTNWIANMLQRINSELHISLKSTEFRGAVGIVSMYVNTDKDTDEILDILQQNNPRIRTKYWRKISTVRSKNKLEVVLQIDKLSAQVITSQNFNRYIGQCAVHFELGHLKSLLKPKSSLEVLSKMHAKKTPKNGTKNKILKSKETICLEHAKKSLEELKAELKKQGARSFEDIKRTISNQYSGLVIKLNQSPIYGEEKSNDNKPTPTKSKRDQYSQCSGDEIYFLTGNKSDEFDPIIIEPDPPKRIDKDSTLQGYHKVTMIIPINILPDKKDMDFIFALLEDRNPGLNTEPWRIESTAVYPSYGKVTVYIDSQSLSIIQGKDFNSLVENERIQFYF